MNLDYWVCFKRNIGFFSRCEQQRLKEAKVVVAGVGTTMIILDPEGMTLEELYDAPENPAEWPQHRLPLAKLLGPGRYGDLVRDMDEGRRPYLSNCAGIATLNGGLVATEIALLITGKRPREELITAPDAVYVDLLKREFKTVSLAGNT